MTTINLPTEWPAGWAVGVDEENDVVAQSTDLGVGIHYWIDEDGVEHRNRVDKSPESVRTTARALHRSLGRPCPWDEDAAEVEPGVKAGALTKAVLSAACAVRDHWGNSINPQWPCYQQSLALREAVDAWRGDSEPDGNPDIVPLTDSDTPRHNGGAANRCDMKRGPCACGAWHTDESNQDDPGQFTLPHGATTVSFDGKTTRAWDNDGVELDDPGCTCGGNGLCEHCRARAVPERKAFSTGYRCGLADAEAELDPQPVTVITEDGLAHFDIGPNRISFAIDSRSGAHAWFVNDERMVPALAPDQDQTAESDPDPTPATDEKREDVPERGQNPDWFRPCHECAHYRSGICFSDPAEPVDMPSDCQGGRCYEFKPKPDPGGDYIAIQRDEWTDIGARVGVLGRRLWCLAAAVRCDLTDESGDVVGETLDEWNIEDDQAKETQETPPPQRNPCRGCETRPGTTADTGARAEKETRSRTGCG